MEENTLRWQARVGSLKWLGFVIVILAGIGLILVIGNLVTALNNPGEPRSISIEQVVNGSVRSNQYVALEGFAVYDSGYEETEDGQLVETYYVLLDDLSGTLVVVRASLANVSGRGSSWIKLVGMTHNTPMDLEQIIQDDFDFYRSEGFLTTAELYIAEGEKPSSVPQTAALGFGLFVLLIVGVIPFFLPTTVFAPKPVEMVTADSSASKGKESGVFASGRFIQLKKIKPTLEMGKRMQKFSNSVSNIIPMKRDDVMVYIHHIVRYNFIPVSKTHWGVFLNPRNVQAAEPGLQYGWKDRPAVQISYTDKEGKPDNLLLSFHKVSDQAFFIKLLRDKGFKVGSGISFN